MPSISNYVCVKCEKEMRPEKNGIYIEEHIGYDDPYRIWHADLWKCLDCNAQVIVGFGLNPLACDFETEKYDKFLKSVKYHIREIKTEVQSE